MPVHVDETLAPHPLTVTDVMGMVDAGILQADDHVELPDVEMGATSLHIDLGRKARIYATGNVPEYWVLDVQRRVLVVHRAPQDGAHTDVGTLAEHETVPPVELDLTVPVAALL